MFTPKIMDVRSAVASLLSPVDGFHEIPFPAWVVTPVVHQGFTNRAEIQATPFLWQSGVFNKTCESQVTVIQLYIYIYVGIYLYIYIYLYPKNALHSSFKTDVRETIRWIEYTLLTYLNICAFRTSIIITYAH